MAAGPANADVIVIDDDDDDDDVQFVDEKPAHETLYKEYRAAFEKEGVDQLQIKAYMIAHTLTEIRKKKWLPEKLANEIRYFLTEQGAAFTAFEKALEAKANQARHVDKVEFVTDPDHWLYQMDDNEKPKTILSNASDPVAFRDIFRGKTRKIDGNTYAIMYHGTNGAHFNNISKAIDFNKGGGMLGQGFYLTTHPDEAKCYACDHGKPHSKGGLGEWYMVIEVGVAIEGVGVLELKTQNYNSTMARVDIKRDSIRPNQFAFTPTTLPNIEILKWYFLPQGFLYREDNSSGKCSSFGKTTKVVVCHNNYAISMSQAEETAATAIEEIKKIK